MATSAAEIDFVPEAAAIDFVPDEAPAIDFIPDEVVAQEAQRAAAGAVQAVDVATAPSRLDWSAANENLDAQRLEAARQAEARAKLAEENGSGTGPGSEAFQWRREADFQRGNLSPFTKAGDTVRREGEQQLRDINTEGDTAARKATPSDLLSGFLGTGLSSTAQPAIESAARNLGGATGGALGAAAASAATVGTGGIGPLAIGVLAALGGSMAGSQAQESILQTTETPEETQARQHRAAQDAAEFPIGTRIGGVAAALPFFRPGLAQFGQAAAGDAGAIQNLALAGTIGAGTQIGVSLIRGEPVKPEDVAEAFFSNVIMNEPTRLGRRLGLHPSSEQAAAEEAQAKYAELPPPEPIGQVGTDLTTRGATSTADVFARIHPPPDPKIIAEFDALPKVEPPAAPATETPPPVATPEAAIQAEAQKVGPVIYDGVTQMGEDGFYNFSDTTSKPGTRISFTVESKAPPTAEQIAAKHAERLDAFEVKPAEPPPTEAPAEPPVAPKALEVAIDAETIDATEALRDRFDPKRRTAMVFRFPDDKPQILYRGISERELKAIEANPEADIAGGRYSVPLEREYGAQYAATPEEAMRAAFHDEKAKGVEGEKKYLIQVDARGKLASHLDPRATTTPELSAQMRYLIPTDRVSGNLGVSVKVPFKDVLSVKEIIRKGRDYSIKNDVGSSGEIKLPGEQGQGSGEASRSVRPLDVGTSHLPQPPTSPIGILSIRSALDGPVSGSPARPTVSSGSLGEGIERYGGPPKAAPRGVVPPDPNSTSNKESVVNAERAARDLDPVIKEARISNADSIDRAQQIVTENPLKPQEIVTRLRDNPQERTISLEDSAVLLVERTRLNKERQALLDRANDESLDPVERAAAKGEFSKVETRLNELDQAAQDARSTWGRFGQLWQRSMRQDFTLEAMESRARLAKGEALSPEESAQIKTIADDVAAKQQEADVAVAKAGAAQAEQRVDEVIAESAKQPDVDPAVRTLADRIIAKLDLQAETARKNLREYFKNLNNFVPDPRILKEFTILAASRIAKGAIKSGQWISEMVKEFGEASRPYLVNAYEAANTKLDELVNAHTGDKKKRATVKAKVLDAGEQQSRVTAALAERIKEGESLESLGRYVDKLVDSLVRGGVRDRNTLTAAVKDVLEPLAPGITDQKVHELISHYGQSTALSKDPIKVVARDLRGQLQQVTKLEKLAAKEPLKKTGPERRTASDEERRLIKEVNAAKKEAGVVTTDPATQLKSTLDSARTRFTNEIKDLTFEIDTGQRPPNRTPVEYTQDIEILRGLRDRLKATVRDLEGPKQLTEEERIRITTRGLQDSIAALENRLAGKGVEPKARQPAPNTPEIQALKAKREALRAQVNEINSADALLRENRKAEALVRSITQAEAELAGSTTRRAPQQGPESQLVAEAKEQLAALREQLQAKRDADPAVQQERMDAAEAAVEKSIKKLDEQIQAGDLSVQRAPTAAGSQRLEDLRLQRDAMNRLRNQLRIEARPKPNPLDVAIKARKAQLLKQEADTLQRIANKDFGPRTRKPPLDLSSDPAALDALARAQTAKDQFGKLQKQWELEHRTRTQKVLAGIKQTWDAVRNLKLSMDLSAPLQTAFAIAAHPVEGVKAIGKGARAFAEQLFLNSDKYAKRVEQQIINSRNNQNGLYKTMKLDLSEIAGMKREENAGSILERLADLESRWEDIPTFAKGLLGMNGQQLVKGTKGIAKMLPKLLGLSIKASNVSFGAIANHMRTRTADTILERSFRRRGAPTKAFLELLGNQVNAATGKGGLRGEEGIRALLFAPNYYLSILKQITAQPLRKALVQHEGAAAREVLEEYVRAAATVTTIGVLQYLFGNRDKQTLDPRSPNFARAMTDKGTAIDFTMGRGAYVTLASQIATGKRINRQGRVEKQDPSQAFLSFLKGRLSREISAGLTTAVGNDFKGKPVDAAGLAKELIAPISWQDVDKVIKREGLTRGSFIQMLNLLGVTPRLSD